LIRKPKTLRVCAAETTATVKEFGNQLESVLNRSDLNPVGQVDYLLARDRVPSEECLRHGIDLIIVRAVRESGALLDEVADPRRIVWVG
jgi:hypothetical protein